MATDQELETSAQAALEKTQQTQDKTKQFCALWQGTIRPVLEHLKMFPKVGKVIKELETALDGVCNSNNPDIKNYCIIWNKFHLEAILRSLQIVVGDNVKKAFNLFIELSDELCPKN